MGRLGPLAIVDLETTGLVGDPEAEILEFGALLLDADRHATVSQLVRPSRPLPRAVARLTGLADADLKDAPPLAAVTERIRTSLAGRRLVAHNAEFERYFLGRQVASELSEAGFLDTLDLLSLTHPDAPDLRLETFVRSLLGREERHRALDDARDTACVLAAVARGARAGEARYRTARSALERFAPDSPWRELLRGDGLAPPAPRSSPYVPIGASVETPVAFDEDAVAAALGDEARGRRHFPDYRVREAQIRLARRFVRNLDAGGVALLEGGTGVGKSLAYLAAAIPFALERGPVVISTRTKLLQDQLLAKDIAAAARMLGHAELRALSIKGRANYACARRLERCLSEGGDPRLFPEERLAHAALLACARTRPHGELGAVPGALPRRFPGLRDLLHRSVARRAEQCSRERCAREESCAFGRRRSALAEAHLVVANHDLLLRWPPDYPRLANVVVDEVHELADVADEVYALEVRPQDVLERIDEVFGRPGDRGREALLPGRLRRSLAADALAWRREIQQELLALGRVCAELAEFGELDVPPCPGPRFDAAANLARRAAERLASLCDTVEERTDPDAGDAGLELSRTLGELRGAAGTLRLPFEDPGEERVAAFEALDPPFDRWRLVVRAVDPSDAFHQGFLQRLEGFAGVSASLFVGGDAFAALGELDLDGARDSVPSPFPYAEHMRVVALESGGDLVGETTELLAQLCLRLSGRTLGLFTSLARMQEVAGLLSVRLREAGIDVLLPRRATDDPQALVSRFVNGGSVLLGARRFWQGLDIPGPALQAVVIEKLPFEVPTELRRRREARLGRAAFDRYTLGKMLLNLKQMTGRLIRSETDRGIVVIVDARTRMRYFGRLAEALPEGVAVRVTKREEVAGVMEEIGL